MLFPFTTAIAAFLAPSQSASFDVTSFGAVPDDGLDDRAAIVSTLEAACLGGGGEVFFPAGVYDVSVPGGSPGGGPVVILPLPCPGLTLRGSDTSESRLRVMAAQPPWESLLGSPGFAGDVSGLELRDLVLDGNGAQNPVDGDDSVDDIFTERRHALRVYTGSDVSVRDCSFVDWRNVNVITLNGVDVSDAEIVQCQFANIGGAPVGAEDWDHSTIYTDCDGAVVEDCTFTSSSGPGTFGVRAAIELHGPRQIARRNIIDGFTTGLNLTGISALGGRTTLVDQNRFLNVSDGIRIWTQDLVNDPPGPSLVRSVIRRNLITVDIDGWRPVTDQFAVPGTGISLERNSDGAVDQLTIVENTIHFRELSTARPWDRDAHAISFDPISTPTLSIQSLSLVRNRLLGAPATSIFLSGHLRKVRVTSNTAVNGGQGPQLIPDGLRSFALVTGFYADVVFNSNTVVDSASSVGQIFHIFATSQGGNAIESTRTKRPTPVQYARFGPGVGVPWSIKR